MQVVVELKLEGRCALDMHDPDRVQGDVDTAGRGGHRGSVLLDRPFVEGIDHRHLRGPAFGHDVPSDCLELLQRATGQKDACTFLGKRASDGATDRSSPSIDDSGLVLEQHGSTLL